MISRTHFLQVEPFSQLVLITNLLLITKYGKIKTDYPFTLLVERIASAMLANGFRRTQLYHSYQNGWQPLGMG
jgi:hypothetical protein